MEPPSPTLWAESGVGSSDVPEWPPDLVELYRTERVRLVRLAYLLTGRAAEAEELVQDAFIATREAWGRVRQPGQYLPAVCRGGVRYRLGQTDAMRLEELADTTAAVRATSSRKAKAELLAELLGRLAPAEIVPAVGMLLAQPRQGAIGVGWATVSATPSPPAPHSSDEAVVDGPGVVDFDRLITELARTTGTGSEGRRIEVLRSFLARCSEAEDDFVRRVLVGDARQGALAGVMTDAGAKAAGVKAAVMRRAVMLRGDLGEAIAVALIEGPEALAAIDLEVGRPIQPMLASTSSDVAAALVDVGALVPGADTGDDERAEPGVPASVEWKLDGARIQVHVVPAGDGPAEVMIVTRNLNDVTSRLPQVVDLVRSFDCRSVVLDGEVLGFLAPEDRADTEDSPQAFQHTMSALSTESSDAAVGLRAQFFDLMFLDGESLIDRPLSERLEALSSVVGPHAIPRIFTTNPTEAQAHLDQALAQGHEGVMVKAGASSYEAGRRGKSWRKVKPVHTLDLVVLAAEWGHGRRQGWLSNLHLGARNPDDGSFVMVGKTFKGLTDELLGWQTEQFLARALPDQPRDPGQGHTVHVRPELVVEIALDGAQASTRYPGGVALRFARVRGYRPDRDPSSADALDAVRALLPRS